MKKIRPRIGWREKVSLPELGIGELTAKIDTGAKTSALDASNIEEFEQQGLRYVRFVVNGIEGKPTLTCEARLIEQRSVTDSGGHSETRYVIETDLELANHRWPVEITLTERSGMKYRMLIGRSAIRRKFVVDPAKSFFADRVQARKPPNSKVSK